MKYNLVPKTQDKISQIGFGCMSLHEISDENISLIHQAIEAGINYFDTADLYDKGINEELLGRAVKGKREGITIATKVGNKWNNDGNGWTWYPKKSYILEAAEKSLKRLNIDVIDLYQLHGGTLDDDFEEVIEAFEILKETGKIKDYGFSSIRPNVIRKLALQENMVSCMTQYNLLDRRPEETTLDILQENKIAVMVRGALAGGLLLDKEPKDYLDYSKQEIENLQKEFKKIALDFNKSPTQSALQFLLKNNAVSSLIIGIRNKKHLDDALSIFDNDPISKQEWNELDKLFKPKQYAEHR